MANTLISKWKETKITAVSRGNDGLYPFLLLCAAVFIIVMPWHAVNHRLPIWDSADYVLTVQNILGRSELGFLESLKAIYLERGWRPIIFPTLAVPFFWLADGQILLGVGLTQYFTVLLLASYIYLFLRQSVSSQKALIGSLLVISVQWITDFSNVFYSELFWLAATAGVLYHLTSALRHASLLHFVPAGLWLGLMGALRPIETATLASFPVAALVFHGWKQGGIRSADLGLFAAQLLAAGLAVWLLAMPHKQNFIVVALLAISALVSAYGFRSFFSASPLLGFLLIAEVVALAWHLPTIRLLYLWVYDTSFGPLAKLSDQRFSGLAPWTVFWELLQRYSPKSLSVLAFASILGAAKIWRSPHDADRSKAIAIVVAALLMMTPMLILLSISGTSDMRRIMPGMLVLTLGLVVLSLSPNGFLPRTRTVLLFLVMAIQLANVTANGLNIRTPILLKAQELAGYLRPPYTGPDPNPPVLDGILGLGIRSGRVSAYTYCYRDYANCERKGIPMFEPVALSTLAKERRLHIHVHFIGDLDFSKPETLSAQIRGRGFDYVLVDMFDSPAAVNWEDPYVIHTKNFISLVQGRLPAGLINLGCFSTLKRPICVIKTS